MSFQSWLRKLKKLVTRTDTRRARPNQARLQVEPLEDRMVLSTINGGTLLPPPSPVEGQSNSNLVLYHFTDSNPNADAGDFAATVRWGDGTSASTGFLSSVSIVASGSGFDVKGSHTYQDELTNGTFSVTVSDSNNHTVSASTAVSVADAALTAGTITAPHVTEGQSVTSQVLFHFSDANSLAGTSDYTATVQWGDGTTSSSGDASPSVSVVAHIGGGFDVKGSHTYTGAVSGGTFRVSVADKGGQSATASATLTIADAPLTAGSLSAPTATEGQATSNQILFHFSDGNASATTSDYTAVVQWGDGTSSSSADASPSVSVVAHSGGGFDVKGSHTYQDELSGGTFRVTVTDKGGQSASASTSVSVADAALTAGALTVPTATEGKAVSGAVLFHFSDADSSATTSDYTAVVQWGDGTSNTSADLISPVSVVAHSGGGFDVVGSHTYQDELAGGTFRVSVSDDGGQSVTASGTVGVAEAALADQSALAVYQATEGSASGDLVLATFSDANPYATAGDFGAVIHWGDGTSSTGTVQGGAGLFSVHGSHTYQEENAAGYAVTVDVAEDGGVHLTGIGLSIVQVADAGLTDHSAGATFQATEGALTGDLAVAVFSDANPYAAASDFGAVIHWGDGTSSTGSVQQGSGGWFSIHGSHAYQEETLAGYTVTADVTDDGGATLTGVGRGVARVADAPLADASAPTLYQATEGSDTGTLTVATFTDTDSNGTAGDYAAVIHWGDGTTSAGTVRQNSDGSFAVTGSHTYLEENAKGYAITADVSEQGGGSLTAVGQATVQVADAALSDLSSGATVQATEGAGTGTLTVASFSDADPNATAGDFGAVIHWGDGTTSAGTVQQNSDGSFAVTGSHTYREENATGYAVTVDVSDQGGATLSAVGQVTVQVGDAALTDLSAAATVQATEGAATGRLTLATFTDANPGATTGDFGAVIHWGDGTSSAGFVCQNSDGSFSVHGSHTYQEESAAGYAVSVDVSDAGGSALAGIGQATVQVADAALTDLSAAATLQATEGAASATLTVAAFSDANPGASASDFGAVIHWGDDTTSAGTVQQNSDGSFSVTGGHTYQEDNASGYAVTVDITDNGGSSLTGIGQAVVQVADAALTDLSSPATFQATEGAASDTLAVASFSDANPNASASDFGAVIHWGDGNSSAGTVTQNSDGSFSVTGGHTYQEDNASGYAVTVDLTDTGGASLTGIGQATVQVADAALTDQSAGVTFQATEGATSGRLTLATFTDANPDASAGDFGAVIHWGDGTSSTGLVCQNSDGSFSVHGSHTYQEESAAGYAVSVDVTDRGGSALAGIGQATVQVADAALTDLSSGATFQATEGAASDTLTVATFSDANPGATADDFGAVIHWGDGTSSTGTVQQNSDGSFSVSGNHTYQEDSANGYAVTVDVTDQGGSSLTGIGQATVQVADADLTDLSSDTTYQATEGASSDTLTVAAFSDANPGASASDFGAVIHWGDDTTSAGTVQQNSDGSFSVTGSHTYLEESDDGYAVTVDVTDNGGSNLTAIGQATVQVADAALTDLSSEATFQATEGAASDTLTVATFSDANPGASASDFGALIYWGDGTSSAGSVQQNSDGSFSVTGGHTYQEDNASGYAVTVDVTDQGGSTLTAIGQATVQVADAALADVSAATIFQATEGAASGRLTLAAFTDANPGATTGDFGAVIHWGDGTSSAGFVCQNSDGSFSVRGSHTYAEENAAGYAVTVDVTDAGGNALTAIGQATVQVADAALTDLSTAATAQAAEGAGTGTLTVATFSDADPNGSAGDYGAVIHWGDGTTSAGTIQQNSDGSFAVTGSHTYLEENAKGYAVTVDVSDQGGAALTGIGLAVVQVADAALADLSSSATFQATEGAATSDLVLATFNDANPGATAGDFSACIRWGDGTWSAGSVQQNSDGSFSVHGTHTYQEENAGGYGVSVTVSDAGGSTLKHVGRATVQVADAPLTAHGTTLQATEGQLVAGVVATFTDADPAGTVNDYSAVITWGDGQASMNGVIAYDPVHQVFTVTGSHVYGDEGDYSPAVQIFDDGGASVTAVGMAVVADNDTLQVLSGPTVSGTEGVATGPLTLASFSDTTYPSNPAGNLQAAINWGDGTSSTGTVLSTGGGNFTVRAGHTYAEEGHYNVGVTILDDGVVLATAAGTAGIADAALADRSGPVVYHATEQASTGDLVLATFTDPGTDGTTGDYGAVIHWGDGTTSAGTVQKNGDGSFSVHGSHTYAEENAAGYAVTVDVTDAGGSALTAVGQATVQVADAALADQSVAATVQATEQAATGDVVVATFADPGSDGTSNDYTATIHWGDGASSTGTVTRNSDGSFRVHGSHTYQEENPAGFAVLVDVTDAGGGSLTAVGKTVVKVADAALNDQSATATYQATEQASTGDLVLATFTDAGSDGTVGDYNAVIHWGDGTTSAGSVLKNSDGSFSVHGSHTYAEENIAGYRVTVDVSDHGGSALGAAGQTTVRVADAALADASTPATYQATEQASTGDLVLATFCDPGTDGTAADYSAVIHWGDGTSSAGTVQHNKGGTFGVHGSHSYAEENASGYTVTVDVSDAGGSTLTGIGRSVVQVADAALADQSAAATVQATEQATTGDVVAATFTDPGTDGTGADYGATIHWGDGSSSAGSVQKNGDGSFSVHGSHTYREENPAGYVVTVDVADQGGSTLTAIGKTVVKVADAALTDLSPAVIYQATEQASTGNRVVATFADPGTDGTTADYSAVIHWGDGTSSTGCVQKNSDGSFSVHGNHTYAEESAAGYAVTVDLSDTGGSTLTGIGGAVVKVADAALADQSAAATYQATEQAATGDLVLATFTDPGTDGTTADYGATIHWGDGTSSAGSVQHNSDGSFSVHGSHTYAEENGAGYTVTVDVTDQGGSTLSAVGQAVVQVADAGLTDQSASITYQATEQAATGDVVVASFTDPGTDGTTADYGATIHWGDGSTSAGTVQQNSDGSFSVHGSHTYAEENASGYAVTVDVTDAGGSSLTAIGQATVQVADAALADLSTAATYQATEQATTGDVVVATFADPGSDGGTGDYGAVIHWGDGSSSTGTVQKNSGGSFSVHGSHTYAEENPAGFAVTVDVADAGGSTLTAVGHAVVKVADAPLQDASSTMTYQAGEQASTGDLVLAGFTDPGTDGSSADYAAVIHWGDGTTATGTVQKNSDGSYSIHGSHTYAEESTTGYAVTVDVTDQGGSGLTGIGHAVVKVADASLSDRSSAVLYLVTEQAATGNLTVATFADTGTDGSTKDYSAVIHWGDGNTSAGTIQKNSGGTFSVQGSHTYAEESGEGYAVTVDVTDQGGSTLTGIGKATVRVADAALSDQSSAATVQATEHAATGDLVVARFADPGSDGTTADYGAVIHWGDGSSSAGSVQQNSDGSFSVHGSHTYAEENPAGFAVTVDVTDQGGSSLTAVGKTVVRVADAGLINQSTPAIYQATEQAGTGDLVLATFGDAGTDGTASDYSAVIHWGDGTSSTGSVTKTSGGSFAVHGSHTYAEQNAEGYLVTVDVTDQGGSTLSGIGQAVVQVAEVAPANVTGVSVAGSEGQNLTGVAVATFTDPAGAEVDGPVSAEYAATINWGDGTTSAGTITYDSESEKFTVRGSHTYLDSGENSIGVSITHGGTAATGTATASIANVAPTITQLNVDQTDVMKLGSVSVSGTFTDPGILDTHTVSIDWGDGSSATNVPLAAAVLGFGGGSGFSHQYQAIGNHTITVTVSDDDDGQDQASRDVTVTKDASSVAVTPPALIPLLGQSLTFTATVTGLPPAADTPTGTVIFYDGGTSLGQGQLTTTAGGQQAAFTVAANGLAGGPHTITAQYLGDVTFQAGTSAPVNTTVMSASQAFVAMTYQDVLGRPADPTGLAAWSGALDHGAVTPLQVVLGIENSLEHRINQVQALYERYLHRAADPQGLSGFVSFLMKGGTVEQAAAALVSSNEFFTVQGGGTVAGFVTALYNDALGHGPDPATLQGLSILLTHGMPFEQAASLVFASTEYEQDVVQAAYLEVFHRAADPQGLSSWTVGLQSGMSDDVLVAELMTTSEGISLL